VVSEFPAKQSRQNRIKQQRREQRLSLEDNGSSSNVAIVAGDRAPSCLDNVGTPSHSLPTLSTGTVPSSHFQDMESSPLSPACSTPSSARSHGSSRVSSCTSTMGSYFSATSTHCLNNQHYIYHHHHSNSRHDTSVSPLPADAAAVFAAPPPDANEASFALFVNKVSRLLKYTTPLPTQATVVNLTESDRKHDSNYSTPTKASRSQFYNLPSFLRLHHVTEE
jgi:hypothetical protein